MFTIKDQLNRFISLDSIPPKRIVSLVPSQTELLYYLGLDEEVIGITKFCVHPQQWFKSKTRIGGTKKVNVEKVKALQPDLIIGNKEENVKEQIDELEKIAPVWISDVNNFDDALEMIKTIGEIVNKKEKAQTLISQIETNFLRLTSMNYQLRTAYLIWRNPYMTIGGDTFINDMLKKCGLQNIFENETRYPEITISQLQNANCQIVLLSSEPYPFKEVHLHEIQEQLTNAKVLMVDGEMFSWYGSRMLNAAQYFSELINFIYRHPPNFSSFV